MSLSIDSAMPATEAANVAPVTAVKATSDTQSAAPSPKQASAQATAPSIPQDTIKISTAALAALQESRETPAQTAQEAAHGDRQAVKLLAKETANK